MGFTQGAMEKPFDLIIPYNSHLYWSIFIHNLNLYVSTELKFKLNLWWKMRQNINYFKFTNNSFCNLNPSLQYSIFIDKKIILKNRSDKSSLNAFLENIVLNKPYIIILFHPDRWIEDAHKPSHKILILNTRLSIKMYSKVIYRLNREAKRGICSSILLEGLLNSYSLFHIWITNHLTLFLKDFPK